MQERRRKGSRIKEMQERRKTKMQERRKQEMMHVRMRKGG